MLQLHLFLQCYVSIPPIEKVRAERDSTVLHSNQPTYCLDLYLSFTLLRLLFDWPSSILE